MADRPVMPFRRLAPEINFALGMAFLGAVWSLDRALAGQASTAILYLLPIGFVAWYCGGAWGYATALLSAAAWLEADLALGRTYSHWLIPYWNATTRLGFFIVVTVLSGSISRLRRLVDKERELSELKSNMISLVSHEFGNYLTTLRLSVTLLRESEPSEPVPQRLRTYATVDRVLTHLTGAVANFLNLNRIEARRFVPHIRLTRLRSLIHSIVSQMGPLIESKHVALKIDFPGQPVPVQADPDALSVVLSNLIGKAFKYTPPGGTVTLRIALEQGQALVCVEDTGIGIAEAEQDLIVSGYYRSKASRTVAKGFGVGLKVARELLESQGSRLELESTPGKGSRFFFRLPLAPAGSIGQAEN